MSVYMSFCPECSKKLGQVRVLTACGSTRYDMCAACFAHKSVQQFELGPTWEERRYQRRRSGRRAGERSER